jgi:phosphoglycolate phosphatase-like HAD superfamily hydrolase
MRFEAVVFDFDGTLIQSANAKRDAFFRLFPDEPRYRDVISAVLAEDPDGSRHDVIPRMVETMQARKLTLPFGQNATDRIGAYTQAVYAAQAAADECPGATDILRRLKGRTATFLSSNTPEVDLVSLVEQRGWSEFFLGMFGYPREKTETLANIVWRHGGGNPARVAVVGDGESDEQAADANGCRFFRICGPRSLVSTMAAMEGENV